MKRKKKLFIIFSAIVLVIFTSLLIFNVKGEEANYIYLDLNCGHVTIDGTNYSGCIYETIDGVTSKLTVSGTHLETNQYYVYQSNTANQTTTGNVDGTFVLPIYDSLSAVVNSFINNNNVDSVISTWNTEATSIGRESTGNRIILTGASPIDIIIDNIWSKYHDKSTGRNTGGISLVPSAGNKTTLKLKGDSRIGNLYYATSTSASTSSFKFSITSFAGDKETTGSLTVANMDVNSDKNYWDSGIGGSDSGPEGTVGLTFDGGTIYVGTTKKDNCTAIGGGGNAYGHVTINGGIVTAVSNSTGTAIGGGIGYSSYGGNAKISITGGKVYAYNTGQSYTKYFVPGVAIGGGSSYSNYGNTSTTIDITGGEIYAESVGGVAIGGGSSAQKSGGAATITIDGDAKVTAKSTSSSFTYNSVTYEIPSGSGIGGGTGGTSGNGGNAVVTIKNGEVYSGTIGGGERNNTTGTVGSATIKIEGGTTTGRILMNTGTFDMSGGILTGGSSENGGCVQMNGGDATISGGEIKNCSSTNDGGAIYILDGTFTSSGGSIHSNTSRNNGGAVYLGGGSFTVNDGNIYDNISSNNGGAIYLGGGTFEFNKGNIYNNESTNNGGGIFLEEGTFTVTGGSIYKNNAAKDGGAIYLTGGIFTTNGGNIYENQGQNGGSVYVEDGTVIVNSGIFKNNTANLGNGGAVYIGGGIYEMHGGEIINNTAVENGGGVYQESGTYTMTSGNINYNTSKNGGGAYLNNATFTLTGGSFNYNEATQNGGGFYVGDNSTVSLSNGTVAYNKANSGAGFYQTQTDNLTTTILTGDCTVDNNIAEYGNGGGIYIDGGSIFRAVGGKITYNSATVLPGPSNLTAKESTYGVGGGVYIKKGTFSMYDESDNPGTAAVFGNIAEYSADDLFASGEETSFDAISVITMDKDDAYKSADSWFEDYPENEEHITLNYEKRNDSDTTNDTIISAGRYKDMTSIDEMALATTVLYRNCNDYIAITMGNSIGSIEIIVTDENVSSDHSYIYKIEGCKNDDCTETNTDTVVEVIVFKNDKAIINSIPSGEYKVTLISDWSWRFNDTVDYQVIENKVAQDIVNSNSVVVNVFSGQPTKINTYYNYTNKNWLYDKDITEWSNTGGDSNA